jgi:hypothetical protein
MAFINLSDEVMLATTLGWLKGTLRPTIEKYPLLKAVLPALEDAHQQLLANQSVTDATELTQLQQDELAVDQVHDHKARGIANLLLGLLDLVDDPHQAQPLIDLRARLYPDGLAFTKASFMAEVGNAEVVKSRMTAEDHALLARIPVLDKTLEHHFEMWMDAAARLGTLEGEKGELTKAAQAANARGPHLKARNRWVEVVTAFVANANLVDDLTDDEHDSIFGPLLRAGRTAHRTLAPAAATAAASTPATPPVPAKK